MVQVKGVNHAVLFVSDVDRSVQFYTRAFGMTVVDRRGSQAAFLRAPGSSNHHDLGLMQADPRLPRGTLGGVGLYHLAWQVETIDELAEAIPHLADMGALIGASDHGATKSLYGRDPDGLEFEVLWVVPREAWGEFENKAVTRPLDLERELARFGKGAAASR